MGAAVSSCGRAPRAAVRPPPTPDTERPDRCRPGLSALRREEGEEGQSSFAASTGRASSDFHSRTSRCASEIYVEVIFLATRSRSSHAISPSMPGSRPAARLNHL